MADIRSYIKEKEKRERKQEDYKVKIVRHKLAFLRRILLAAAVLLAVVLFFYIQYKRRIYTDYDIVSSVAYESIGGTKDVRMGNVILTYSKDGAHCTDARGNVVWNQTFEIQDVRLAVSGNAVAIGDYNGRSIYLANSEKLLGTITTTMPIRDLAVSEAGYVAAVLTDSEITWVNRYNSSGEMLNEGRTHADDSGYPMALSLSPNGEMLCVAYLYLDAGVLKTKIGFYNFGPVGSNANDHLVSSWSYTDMLIPYVRFLDNDTVIAVGDSRLMIYSGSHIPGSPEEHIFDREIQSVCCDDRYAGVVFFSDNSESRYQINIYDTINLTAKPKILYFDMEYTDIFFDKGNIVIYNETECQIITMDGITKFHGSFTKPVKLMLSTGKAYKYLLVTDGSADTIQLK